MSAAAIPRHPRVPVWLRPLTRRRGEVQFGVLPGGPVITGISATEVELLEQLDGALPLASTDRVAAEAGVPPERWRALLGLLAGLDVLAELPATPTTDAVPQARVVVDGCGRVSAEIAAALVRTGVTVVHGRAAVDRAVAAPAHPRPELVVLVGSPVVDPRRGDLWLRHRIPHLPVAPAGPQTVIGPLVDGSPAAPCLWCLDRHRADRDAAWPTVMSQATPSRRETRDATLGAAVDGTVAGAHESLAPGLTQLVVGSVTLLVTGLLEGHAPPPGVSVEVSPPWPRLDHRRWLVHPLCPGHRRETGPPRDVEAVGEAGPAVSDEAGGDEGLVRRGA